MITFFRGLRGKLTLTYTLVTVLALLALEILLLAGFGLLSTLLNDGTRAYLSDVIYTLYPQARAYVQPGAEDLDGLQEWLDGVYASGKASLEPANPFDSPAARIAPGDPLVVLDPARVVLAQSPGGGSRLVGRRYDLPDFLGEADPVARALAGEMAPARLSARTPAGDYWLAVPVREGDTTSPVRAVIVLTVKPPPPAIVALWPVLLGWVGGTALVLLVGVAPFGALFGFIMSRGLTRRLAALSATADAWSEGNFSLGPQDRSDDEIGALGARLRHMAERLQDLLKTQKALAMLEERNRLARELHDTVKQQTFATLMQVRAARNLIERDPPAARQHLQEAEALIKTSQEELSLIIAELRPAALDEQGLAGALRQYARVLEQTAHIPTEVQVRGERSLPVDLEQALYRVAQEALSNVARHSRATAARVLLEYLPGEVRLEIVDNGVGFDPAAAGGPAGGFGLRSMGERVAALGGALSVDSLPGEGTTVRAVVPAAS